MHKEEKKVIITFDYEVFLGRDTGSISKSVINPTREILSILTRHHAKAIFFVDAAWLIFLYDQMPSDFERIAQQLKEIIASGSSVELHLHPQWRDATVQDNRAVFRSFKNYRLHALSKFQIEEMFSRAVSLLEGITACKPRAFRAGGWCIEPFDILEIYFRAHGIRYDFSVAPGLAIQEGKGYDFDYTKAPFSALYQFKDNVLQPHTGGEYVEVPVSTYPNNPLYRLFNKILLELLHDKIFGDGKGLKEKTKSTVGTLSRRLQFSRSMLTIDKTSPLFFRYLLKFHFSRTPLLVVVSHPKTTSKLALKNLEYLVRTYATWTVADLENMAVQT